VHDDVAVAEDVDDADEHHAAGDHQVTAFALTCQPATVAVNRVRLCPIANSEIIVVARRTDPDSRATPATSSRWSQAEQHVLDAQPQRRRMEGRHHGTRLTGCRSWAPSCRSRALVDSSSPGLV
jgi:hypothetical protein